MVDNAWYNALMREATELYQFAKRHDVFMDYADLIRYQDGRLVIEDSEPFAYILLHSLSKAIMAEDIFLVPTENNNTHEDSR